MDRQMDFRVKIEAIRAICKDKGFDGVELKSQTNFSYVTRGRGFIGLASVMACASLFITKDQVVLIGENIDAPRLYEEQLMLNPEVELMVFPWDEPQKRSVLVETFTKGFNIASESDIENELFKMRTSLSEYDQEDYRKLGLEAAQIVENICKNLTPGISEYALAGEVSKQLWENNIEPITLLIAFDERALKYRHPVMTANQLKNYALVGICGRRNGLIISLTRDVLLKHDSEMIEKHKKCARVNAAFWNALTPGERVSNVFSQGVAQYGVEGDLEEYKEHHQGGLTGFIPRELRATYQSEHIVRRNEAYAFNPTYKGAKVEDTVLVTDTGLEVITFTDDYAYEVCEVGGKNIKIPTVFVIDVN